MKFEAYAHRVAVMGGAFDPPHLGHRIAAQDVHSLAGCKRILFIPTGVPAFKTAQTPYSARLALAQACFSDLGEVLDLERTDSAWSSTFETLSNLRPKYGELAFVMGTDQIIQLPKWKYFPEVLSACHWILLERKGGPSSALESIKSLEAQGVWRASQMGPQGPFSSTWEVTMGYIQTQFAVLPTRAPELSSSNIRAHMALHGTWPEDTLHKSVQNVIKEGHLYGL